jgi:ABC-2 type transport system ATP-binding protein
MNLAVHLSELSKKFRRVQVLNRLTLEVPEGSVYALIGSNGAGKTTTIKILMNIYRPSSGQAQVFGIDSRGLSPQDFRRIGYVSENQEMPDWMTVEYYLRYLRFFYPEWDDDLASRLVRQFDLPPDRRLRDLSRGMWMKTALVSSLAYRPRLLVLDEPFGGLDPLVRDEFIEGVLECASETTVLISSHDLAEIESFASHIGYLDEGCLRFSEEMATLAERFREIEVVLEAPPPLPSPWPGHWLNPETSAAVVRFVETSFQEERTVAEIHRLFPGLRNLSVRAMPLRSIFVTLAKASRKAA